jgi:HEAT repeat protein
LGFTVKLFSNPNSAELKKVLNDMAYGYGREENRALLFYYAGHGQTEMLADGTKLGYIIPRDCPLLRDDPQGFVNRAVSMKDIETCSLRIRAKHVLMLFDSCFSGSLFSLVRAVPEDITEKSSLPVRQYITAGTEDETVPDKSMFKRCLLLGLEGDADLTQDGYITGTELGLYLSDKVVQATDRAQHPQYGKIRTPELARGDFIFDLSKAQAAEGASSLSALEAETQRVAKERARLEAERKRLAAEQRRVEEEGKLAEERKRLAGEQAKLDAQRKRMEEEKRQLEQSQQQQVASLPPRQPSTAPGIIYDSQIRKYQEQENVEKLIATLKDKESTARREAAEALDKLGWKPGNDEEKAIFYLAKGEWDKCEALGKSAVKPLIVALYDEDPHVQWWAVQLLGFIKDPRAVEPLITRLKDKDPSIRMFSAQALGRIKDPRAIDPLIALLADRDYTVRDFTRRSLKEMDKTALDRAFMAILMDKDPQIIRALSSLLAEIGVESPEPVEKALVSFMKNKDFQIIAATYPLFIELGIEGSEPLLIEALNTYGDSRIAMDFLNSGNIELSNAARKWAKAHGYRISGFGGGKSGPRWGQSQ